MIILSVNAAIVASNGDPGFNKKNFGGGMAFHAGTVLTDLPYIGQNGFIYGLGGRLFIPLGLHFAFGGGGASLSMPYHTSFADNSYLSLGYGGITAETRISFASRYTISGGILIGGGKINNLHILTSSGSDTVAALYRQFGIMILAPSVSVEYGLTRAICITLAMDYLLGMPKDQEFLFQVPKMHIGIIFSR